MAEFRIVLSDEAQRNITAIYQWIEDRSAKGATRWYLALHARLSSLESNPHRFALAPENRHFEQEIRNVTFRTRAGRRYRILYTVGDQDITVLFVRGPGQDLINPT